MQETESIQTPETREARRPRPFLRRFVGGYALLLALVLIALAVPLINVNRLQRRIVRSLSESLGRPIHLDRISLTLLPLPGMTIENLVVGEDVAFGTEPFVRASQVRATLRVSSLWRRRVEFSRISFTEPSINLVKTADGKWNIESTLLQAARIEAAPTGQARPGSAPRFPYIEATGARLNLKLGIEKTPVSLTEADIALWLYSPAEWRLRLQGRPIRTDSNVSDTGIFQLEGTLGRAASLTEVPLDLKATWRNVPLGEASRMVLGRDAGLRGSITFFATARGTVSQSLVQAILRLSDARRAEFVPIHSLTLDAECQAIQSASFHTLTDLRCSWPPALSDGPKRLALTGTLPDVRRLSSATFQLGTPGIPAETLLDWLRIASARVGADVTATGSLTGSLVMPSDAENDSWAGEFVLAKSALSVPTVSSDPLFTGDLTLRSSRPRPGDKATHYVLAAIPLALGGRDFATLEGHFEQSSYTLHLTGTATPKKLLALGAALPQLGDGLAEALPADSPDSMVRFDLTSTRTWGGPRVWLPTASQATRSTEGRRSKRSLLRTRPNL